MNNTYGIVKGALIDPEKDVEIWYNYRQNRMSEIGTFKQVDNPSAWLQNSKMNNNDGKESRLVGMYNLSLPVSEFSEKGIYTIYIKPKEIKCRILNVGCLAAFPDIKGIVINTETISEDTELFQDDNLVGYRVEYYSDNIKQDYYRLITSANRADITTQTNSGSEDSAYTFTQSGSLCFLTLTPSTSPSFKGNENAFIGTAGMEIGITNTKFNPVMMEVEMVDFDVEHDVNYMMRGEQVRSLDKGTVTTFTTDGEIYNQFTFSTVKDNYASKDVYELKESNADNIDTSVSLNDLKNVSNR